jgi:uncharacterized protein (UPF0276 family)
LADHRGGFIAPKLGIGMIFSTALRPFLERRPTALDVLEIEPQTLWLADDAFAGPFFEFTPGIELFASLPGHKLVHSVGMPLGGTRAPDAGQCALIRATAERLNSPWVSEHLSVAGTPHQAAGFFLPPLQTEAGVAVAAGNIRAFAAAVGRPVAVETGVAYLARKRFEMPDGDFLARVVEEADCGILLDLHNLYCNARNGRIKLDDFLARIPLDRVWEVHLAGGAEQDGFWLDSHSGPMPDDLRALSREVLASLPNLGALNFEIYDTFLERMDQRDLDRTVEDLRGLWEGVGVARGDARPMAVPDRPAPSPAPSPALWEAALTETVWKDGAKGRADSADAAALQLYTKLARSFRGSMLTRTLPRAIRYLILRDREAVEGLLARYYGEVAPKLYSPLEAQAFADWMAADGDVLLRGLLDYDTALLRIVRRGVAQVVRFPGNPGPVFEALAARRLPALPEPPEWEMEILPDGFTVADFTGSAGPS